MIEINGDHYLLMSIGEWEDLGELGYQFNCVIKNQIKNFIASSMYVYVCVRSRLILFVFTTFSHSFAFPLLSLKPTSFHRRILYRLQEFVMCLVKSHFDIRLT